MSDVILTGSEIAAAVPQAARLTYLMPETQFRCTADGDIQFYYPFDGSWKSASLNYLSGTTDAIRALFAERAHRAQRDADATGTAEHWEAVAAEWEARAVAEAQRADTATAQRDALVPMAAYGLDARQEFVEKWRDDFGDEPPANENADAARAVLDALRALRKQREGGV